MTPARTVRETARRTRPCATTSPIRPGASVIDADLVILCVPVGAMGAAAATIAADLPADAIVSDVASVQASVIAAVPRASAAADARPRPSGRGHRE